MSVTATTADPAKTITVDPQDPLPESDWGPRRWFVFMTQILLFIGLFIALQVGAPQWVTISIIIAIVTVAVLYLIAPSAEQFGKMMQMASAMRAGVSFKQTSTVDAEAGTATTSTTTTGAPPAAELPADPALPKPQPGD